MLSSFSLLNKRFPSNRDESSIIRDTRNKEALIYRGDDELCAMMRVPPGRRLLRLMRYAYVSLIRVERLFDRSSANDFSLAPEGDRGGVMRSPGMLIKRNWKIYVRAACVHFGKSCALCYLRSCSSDRY